MNNKDRLLLDAVLLLSYLVAMNTESTGIPVHEWLSVGLAGLVVFHALVEWDWTVAAVSRFFRRLSAMPRLNLVVDTLLYLAFTLVMLSGFMVSQSILPVLGLPVPFGPTWRIVHAISADFSLVVLGVHLGLHWRWFVNTLKRFFNAPADRSAATKEA